MTIQNTFEDRLLERLRLVVAAKQALPEPSARQPRRRRFAAAATGLATAGVAGALAVVIAGGAQAAYAIDSHPDGRVTVDITSLSDAAGLQAALQDRGIPALVDYSATCTPMPAPPAPSGSQVRQAPAPSLGGVRVQVSKDETGPGSVTFTIDPTTIPAGQSVYITTYKNEMNALSIGIGSKAPSPPCP